MRSLRKPLLGLSLGSLCLSDLSRGNFARLETLRQVTKVAINKLGNNSHNDPLFPSRDLHFSARDLELSSNRSPRKGRVLVANSFKCNENLDCRNPSTRASRPSLASIANCSAVCLWISATCDFSPGTRYEMVFSRRIK
jgi:hypothetical protein